MKMQTFILLQFFIIAYVVFNARWLIPFWKDSLISDLSLLAFLIWCVPLLFHRHDPNPYLLVAAMTVSLLGTLGDLKIAQCFALAMVIGSFYPWSWFTAVWILFAVAWAPSFGWIASQFTPYYQLLRIILAGASSIGLLYFTHFKRKKA